MKKSTFVVNALAISFIAVFANQIAHEGAHGILATLVGAKWTQLNLFFAESIWIGERSAILIGAGGVLWGFFWVARNAHAFIPNDKPQRFNYALLLLLFPYILNNVLFTVFALTGPLPPEIIPTSLIATWFADFGIGWGTFMSGLWIQAPAELERSTVPESVQWGWVATSITLLAIAAFVLLPTIQIS